MSYGAAPYTKCPVCGSTDLLILAERVHSLDGSLADDASENIAHNGKLYCVEKCGLVSSHPLANPLRCEATIEHAADQQA